MDEKLACDKILGYLTYDPKYGYKEFKCQGSEGQSKCCIRRAPAEIRKFNPSAYTPTSVSIGHLPVETMPPQWISLRDKLYYTRFLLERSVNADADADADTETYRTQFAETVKKCFSAMMEGEVEARGYYPQESVQPILYPEEICDILLKKESSSSSSSADHLYSPEEVRDALRNSEWFGEKKKYSPADVEFLLKQKAEVEKSKPREKARSRSRAGAGPTYRAEEVRAVLETEAFPEFAQTLMIDGCFIIELLYRHYIDHPRDAILMDEQRKKKARNDLILLENQIPFFVLQQLFDLTLGIIPQDRRHKDHPSSLTKCVLSFFGNTMGLEMECSHDMTTEENAPTPPHHILHLLHIHHLHSQPPPTPSPSPSPCLQLQVDTCCSHSTSTTTPPCFRLQIDTCCCHSTSTTTPPPSGDDAKSDYLVFNSATQLDSYGLKLHKGRTGHMFDVKFTTPSLFSRLWRRCGLQVPSFIVHDSTETFLRNMIAFELCCPGIERYFTSHAFLMDQLINSPEDVKLLEKAGIIRVNYLGCPQQIDTLFNSICKNVHLGKDGSKFQTQCARVKNYCDCSWPTRRQTLMRDYFNSPWSGLSVFAAFLLLVLTLSQTIYTLLSYYQQ